MDVTRRTLARMLAGAAAVTAAAAPQVPSQAASDEESKSAHEAMANYAQQIAKVAVPMATEPAFHFKA
jgi:hypothetical protein